MAMVRLHYNAYQFLSSWRNLYLCPDDLVSRRDEDRLIRDSLEYGRIEISNDHVQFVLDNSHEDWYVGSVDLDEIYIRWTLTDQQYLLLERAETAWYFIKSEISEDLENKAMSLALSTLNLMLSSHIDWWLEREKKNAEDEVLRQEWLALEEKPTKIQFGRDRGIEKTEIYRILKGL